jgi:hypothetical protein
MPFCGMFRENGGEMKRLFPFIAALLYLLSQTVLAEV